MLEDGEKGQIRPLEIARRVLIVATSYLSCDRATRAGDDCIDSRASLRVDRQTRSNKIHREIGIQYSGVGPLLRGSPQDQFMPRWRFTELSICVRPCERRRKGSNRVISICSFVTRDYEPVVRIMLSILCL